MRAVGAYMAGNLDECALCEIENEVCPTCGSCSGMFTANSMNCLTEVVGLGLPGNGTLPAAYSARIRLAKEAGMQIMTLYKQNIRVKDIVTPEAVANALTVGHGAWLFYEYHSSPAGYRQRGGDPVFAANRERDQRKKRPISASLRPRGPTTCRTCTRRAASRR